jgi:hypothetical protein
LFFLNKNSPRAHTESELDVLGESSRKACEICSSLVQKKKLKKNKISSHKLPKQQSTIFWSQGILGVNISNYRYLKRGRKLHIHYLIFLQQLHIHLMLVHRLFRSLDCYCLLLTYIFQKFICQLPARAV